MGFNDFLGKILGSKGQRDLKEITPFVDKIKAVYEGIVTLSNDELRARTETLKTRIQEYVSADVTRIAELKANIEETEMTHALSDEQRAKWNESIPLRRGGSPDEVAKVTLFLASDLSSYVSGQVINVCGGMNT